MRTKADMLNELKVMLYDALLAKTRGVTYPRLARAHGYVDGYECRRRFEQRRHVGYERIGRDHDERQLRSERQLLGRRIGDGARLRKHADGLLRHVPLRFL